VTLSVLGLLVLTLPLAAASGASPATQSGSGTVSAHPSLAALSSTLKCNDCWAGYGIVRSTGHVTGVRATLAVPKVHCGLGTTLTYFQVGLDGLSTTNDTAIAFVYSYCVSGVLYQEAGYYATGLSFVGRFFNVYAGWLVTLSVRYHSGAFWFHAWSAGVSATANVSVPRPALVAAECVTNMGGSFGLTPFRYATFHDCSARMNHVLVDIGTFGAATTFNKYVGYSAAETSVLARPGALSSDSDFTVKFIQSGP